MPGKRPPKKSDFLVVRVPHDVKKALLDASRVEGRTASGVVRELIEGWLKRAEARARLRDSFQPRRSFAMIMKTPAARRGAAAAAVAALGVVAVVVSPSTAEIDLRAAFDRMDADGNGAVTLEEFSAPRRPGGDAMIVVRGERVEDDGSGEPTRTEEEFWLPVAPPPDAMREGEHAVRVTREVRDGDIVTETVTSAEDGDADVAQMQSRIFGGFDRDADGAVSFEEFQARHMELATSTFARLDADADGKVLPEELAAALPAPPPADGAQGAGALSEAAFSQLDQDEDGAISLEEFQAGPG